MSNTENTVPVQFSLYQDEDYEGFLSCINDFYKGGYPYKAYLDRKNLRRLLNAGDIVITLARDETGRIVGTSSALRMRGRFAGSVLLLLRCIVKEMRGKGIGSRQELFLLEQIRRCFPDTLSLYADVMTHDAVSQTTMLHQGFVFCGLRMCLYKSEIIVPSLKYKDGTKMTQAIYCKSNGFLEKRTLFAPEECRDALKSVYESLGVSMDFCADDVVSCVGESVFQLEINELHKSAELFIDRHGAVNNLTEKLRALISSGYTVVAYINMSLNGCIQAYHSLKTLGFCFSGVKPLSEPGEYLVLSHTRQCVSSSDNIKLPEETMPFYRTIVKEIEHET